jgi:hypothetical protein
LGRHHSAVLAAVVLPLPLFLFCSSSRSAPGGADSTATPPPGGGQAIAFVEYANASMYTSYGVYTLHSAQPGDLMLLYLTDQGDFPMPSGWTPIGDVIQLHEFGYPVKGFYRLRQAGDPSTYTIAQTTGFLSVYRYVDPENPIGSFANTVSESQTPAVGDLRATADGAGAVYFFIGLYHSDILPPAGYEEVYGCRHYDGSSNDTGTGHRLGLSAGGVSGGRIFVAAPDCQAPGEPPYKEAILHVMLNPSPSSASASARASGSGEVAASARPLNDEGRAGGR